MGEAGEAEQYPAGLGWQLDQRGLAEVRAGLEWPWRYRYSVCRCCVISGLLVFPIQ